MTRVVRPPRVLVMLTVVAVALFAGPPATRGTQPARGAGTFKDCPHCPEMVPGAPGSFVMGDEKPPRRVTLEYRFAYSKDKVSFRDWKHCVIGGQCPALGVTGTASPEPVVQVSWVDVQQYLSWLSLETGAEYRLLSEAEWEYLARRPASGVAADGLEWTSDCWHVSYAGAPTDGSSWDADGDCRYHVARGRRPGEPAPSVTKRYRFLFDARDGALGFRVARTM
jgi:formylglycine-generating enzyme required for sulfatase activity